MSHDRWRDQLRDAGADAPRLAALISSGVPSDGLQLAGSAVLAAAPSTDLAAVIHDLAAALRQRGWIGDTELAVALSDHAEQRASELIPIGVDLDDLAEVIDQSPASESYIDLESSVVWPGELLDLDQGPDDFDPDDAGRWLVVSGEGSTAAYGDMERFIATVESEELGNRLRHAISGKSPFKAFLATLQRDDDQFTSWHRHHDDARIGRARHCAVAMLTWSRYRAWHGQQRHSPEARPNDRSRTRLSARDLNIVGVTISDTADHTMKRPAGSSTTRSHARARRRCIDAKVGRIFIDGALSQPLAFDPRRLEGDYALYDDGWPCRLSLRSRSDGGFDARFVSYDRTTGVFPARITLDAVTPHALQLVVTDFNELTEQAYTGYAFARGPAGLAGVTEWKGETFGFFARRQPTWTIGPPQPGPVTVADFRGSFQLWCDGTWALLELDEPDGDALHGRLHERTGDALPVTATIDSSVPHHAVIAVDGVSTVAPTLHVWMFVRPRTALAGWLDWDGMRVGCYLSRCA